MHEQMHISIAISPKRTASTLTVTNSAWSCCALTTSARAMRPASFSKPTWGAELFVLQPHAWVPLSA